MFLVRTTGLGLGTDCLEKSHIFERWTKTLLDGSEKYRIKPMFTN